MNNIDTKDWKEIKKETIYEKIILIQTIIQEKMVDVKDYHKPLEDRDQTKLTPDKAVNYKGNTFKYFSLGYMWSFLQPLFKKYKLAVFFTHDVQEKENYHSWMEKQTWLKHEDNLGKTIPKKAFMCSTILNMTIIDCDHKTKEVFPMRISGLDINSPAQCVGQATTYGKRMLFASVFGFLEKNKTVEEQTIEVVAQENAFSNKNAVPHKTGLSNVEATIAAWKAQQAVKVKKVAQTALKKEKGGVIIHDK